MATKQLKTRQICLFFIAFTFINKIFTLPSIIANVSKNDLWISSFFNVLLDGFTLILMLILSKNTDQDFFTMLERLLTKTGAKIISCFYFLYFFSKSVLPIIEQREYIELTLYIPNPSFLYFLPFFIVCFYIATKKLRILGRLADVLFLSSALGFIVLMALSIPHADFSNTLPIGVNGLSAIIKGSFLSLVWYGDALYFLFFIGNFKRAKKDGTKISVAYFISGIIVVLFMVVFYGIFTSIAYRQKFSLTEISKYTTIINSTGRFDYFAILMLLVSNVVTLSIPLYFCAKILDHIFNVKYKYLSPAIVSVLSLTLTLVLTERIFSAQKIIITLFGIFYVLMANVLPVILLLISKRRKHENS